MAVSGSYTFDPTLADFCDEAFERCGIQPGAVTNRHIISARMSLNLMFAQWAGKDGDIPYRITARTGTLTLGVATLALHASTIDVAEIVVALSGEATINDRPMSRISREDYLRIPDKTERGIPKLYYVDKSLSVNAPTLVVWPTPDAAYSVTVDTIRKVQTVDKVHQTLDLDLAWFEATAAGLAARLAMKFSPGRLGALKAEAMEAYEIARTSSVGRGFVTLGVRGFGAPGRRRRV